MRTVTSKTAILKTAFLENSLVFATCLAVASWTIFRVGVLGFHFEDLSIPWDGGYRILSGQRPFADFFAPIGPVLFLQQALFFKIFGVSLTAFLAHAAILNTIAGWVVWSLLRPFGRALATAGTVMTLAWFYLPPSAPYIDTTAFFWILLALRCLVSGRKTASGSRLILAGACAALAFLTKQNIGALGGIALALFLLLDQRRLRPALWFSTGVFLPLLGLAAYLSLVDAWAGYLTYFWQVPLESGRLKYLTPWFLRMVIKVFSPESVQSSFGELLGPALRELAIYGASLIFVWRYRCETHGSRFLLAGIGMLLLLQQWSFNSSNNDEALYWPFLGLIVGWLFALAKSKGLLSPRVLSTGLLLVTVTSGFAGWWVGRSRLIHSLDTRHLATQITHPRLQGLWMRHPEGEDFEKLLAFLTDRRAKGHRFFVLGHPTLLYGVLGSPAPQPLLWFRSGVSYSATDNAVTDDTIVAALDGDRVEWIVIDPLAGEELLRDFPGLARYLEERYRQAPEDLGAYHAFRRIEPGSG